MKTHIKLLAALALGLPLARGADAAAGNFAIYVANVGHNGAQFSVAKIDAQGNASVFASNNVTLYTPVGVALDASGNVYVSCANNGNFIERFDPLGNNAVRFVSSAPPYPEAMAFDNLGNLVVATADGLGVYKYNSQGLGSKYAAVGGGYLYGLAIDAAGNCYVTYSSYQGAGSILKIDTMTNVTTFATPGNSPYGLAFDNAGNLYAALADTGEIVEYAAEANGTLNTNGAVFASLDDDSYPTGLAFDPAGNLYVVEYNYNQIVKIDPQTNVTVFATNGMIGPVFLALESTSPTTIDSTNHYAYGANFGWMDARGVAANGRNTGMVVGQFFCSGYLYSANVGWINLGSGSPANGIAYQNDSTNDFGVNQDGLGNLRGCAWGANIGWLDFENTGAPRVNLFTGILSGYVWSANCGWISLSNALAYVQTDTISPEPLGANGLPTAWMLTYFGTTNVNPNADPTGNGMTIYQDYLAGTNPTNFNDVLAMTGLATSVTDGAENDLLAWTSHPTREYQLQQTTTVANPAWMDAGPLFLPGAGTETTGTVQFSQPAPSRFFRVQAIMPLAP